MRHVEAEIFNVEFVGVFFLCQHGMFRNSCASQLHTSHYLFEREVRQQDAGQLRHRLALTRIATLNSKALCGLRKSL